MDWGQHNHFFHNSIILNLSLHYKPKTSPLVICFPPKKNVFKGWYCQAGQNQKVRLAVVVQQGFNPHHRWTAPPLRRHQPLQGKIHFSPPKRKQAFNPIRFHQQETPNVSHREIPWKEEGRGVDDGVYDQGTGRGLAGPYPSYAESIHNNCQQWSIESFWISMSLKFIEHDFAGVNIYSLHFGNMNLYLHKHLIMTFTLINLNKQFPLFWNTENNYYKKLLC